MLLFWDLKAPGIAPSNAKSAQNRSETASDCQGDCWTQRFKCSIFFHSSFKFKNTDDKLMMSWCLNVHTEICSLNSQENF